MVTTSAQVLKKIQDLSKMHFIAKPQLGVDSIALSLGIKLNDLMSLLFQLEFEGAIHLHDSDKTNNNHIGLTDKGKVSLV